VLRVLIVDDEPHVRATLVIGLRAYGFEVVGADNAASGLRQFEAFHFDVVVADIYMPDVDGVKFIKTLRERAPNVAIVAISGVGLGKSERTALEYLPKLPGLSAIVCLQKPFRPPELVEAVLAAFEAAETAKSTVESH
jgi:DNA-binding response OmpR family regulator